MNDRSIRASIPLAWDTKSPWTEIRTELAELRHISYPSSASRGRMLLPEIMNVLALQANQQRALKKARARRSFSHCKAQTIISIIASSFHSDDDPRDASVPTSTLYLSIGIRPTAYSIQHTAYFTSKSKVSRILSYFKDTPSQHTLASGALAPDASCLSKRRRNPWFSQRDTYMSTDTGLLSMTSRLFSFSMVFLAHLRFGTKSPTVSWVSASASSDQIFLVTARLRNPQAYMTIHFER